MLTFTGTIPPLQGLPKYDPAVLRLPYTTAYLGAYSGSSRVEGTGSHPGVDIAIQSQPVFAVANGLIIEARREKAGFGNHIVIRHDGVPEYGQIFSGYAHLKNIAVAVGDLVFVGEQIGISGNSGASTGAHLHFQADYATASFHPFWPFAGAEMRQQGMTLRQAVDARLGFAKAQRQTLSPLVWVQEYRDYSFPRLVGIAKSKYKKAIQGLQKLGMISAQTGSYRSDAPLARAEAARLVVLAVLSARLRINLAGQRKPFSDCPAKAKLTPFVRVAKQQGIISGCVDGLYHPTRAVNRAEFIKMVVMAAGVRLTRQKSSFADCDAQAWYTPFVATAERRQWLPWKKKLELEKSVTRAEAAEIVWRTRKNLTILD